MKVGRQLIAMLTLWSKLSAAVSGTSEARLDIEDVSLSVITEGSGFDLYAND